MPERLVCNTSNGYFWKICGSTCNEKNGGLEYRRRVNFDFEFCGAIARRAVDITHVFVAFEVTFAMVTVPQ